MANSWKNYASERLHHSFQKGTQLNMQLRCTFKKFSSEKCCLLFSYKNILAEANQPWNGPYFFIQAADCQLGLIQRYLEKNQEPGWQKEIALTKLAVEKINALPEKPKFFVICGDLCDAFPSKKSIIF